MILLLSLASPLSPLFTNIVHTFSLSSLLFAKVRKGSTADLVLAIIQLPFYSLTQRAEAAAAFKFSGNPSRSFSFVIN